MKGLSALHKLTAGRVVKQFANKHHLVYFGSVDAHSDEHQLVRGVTASATHSDNHYTVGTFGGHDLILVERDNTISYPAKPTAKHHWLILQVDLKQGNWPHIFVDSHHDDTFHANLALTHSKLRDVTSLVPHLGHVRVMAPIEALSTLSGVLTNELAAGLQNFNQFDYEVSDDQVFVYAHNPMVSGALLTDMLRVGVWLAGYLDSKNSA